MFKYAVLVLSVLVLSGCGSKSNDSETKSPILDLSLQDTHWRLTSYGYQIDEKILVLDNSSYGLVFDGASTVSGNVDCNSFSSTYIADESALTFGLIAITEMACPNTGVAEYDEQDITIVNALSAVQSYSVSGDELTIMASDSTQLVFDMEE